MKHICCLAQNSNILVSICQKGNKYIALPEGIRQNPEVAHNSVLDDVVNVGRATDSRQGAV